MKIGIVHPNLNLKGGAEYVTVEMIQALSLDHKVELITFEEPDVPELDSFYETRLSEKDFSVRTSSLRIFFRHFEDSFFKLRNHLIKRYAKKNREDYDLLISGMDEADFGEKGIQYIHFPESVNEQVFHETGKITTDLTETERGLIYNLYLELVERFFKEEKSGVERNLTICNSEFTKSVYEEVFDNKAEVINPPVSMEVEPKEFGEREDSMVIVGNINKTKGQKEVIEIMDQVNRNNDLSLEIVGSDPKTDYSREVIEMAEDRDYVNYRGRVDREELKQILSGSKYGIHNFEGEHYGLVVAEMVKAGCIPFVPSRGGPRGIVENREELIFSGKEDAVGKIEEVLGDQDKQRKLFEFVENLSVNSPEEFGQKIREKVEEFNS